MTVTVIAYSRVSGKRIVPLLLLADGELGRDESGRLTITYVAQG